MKRKKQQRSDLAELAELAEGLKLKPFVSSAAPVVDEMHWRTADGSPLLERRREASSCDACCVH